MYFAYSQTSSRIFTVEGRIRPLEHITYDAEKARPSELTRADLVHSFISVFVIVVMHFETRALLRLSKRTDAQQYEFTMFLIQRFRLNSGKDVSFFALDKLSACDFYAEEPMPAEYTDA